MIDDKYASLAFFQGFSLIELHTLFPLFNTATFVAGTKIFEQGEKADNLFLVASGEVHIRYKPDDGPEMTVTRVQPGGVFGWSAAMGNTTYTSGAICSLDSEILSIQGNQLRAICKRNSGIGEIILKRLSFVIAERQKTQQGNITSLLTSSIYQGDIPGGR